MADPTPTPIRASSGADDPIQVVRRFLGALERLDVDAAADLLTEDVSYQNVPFPAIKGIDAVERTLRWMVRYGNGFEVEWINVAADGGIVLTERVDVLVVGRVRAAFWVCGTFEVQDGRITMWRDRFDFVDFSWAWLKGGAVALYQTLRERRAALDQTAP